jgi:hypothetical protein
MYKKIPPAPLCQRGNLGRRSFQRSPRRDTKFGKEIHNFLLFPSYYYNCKFARLAQTCRAEISTTKARRTRSSEKCFSSFFSFLRDLRVLRGEMFLSELSVFARFAGGIPELGCGFAAMGSSCPPLKCGAGARRPSPFPLPKGEGKTKCFGSNNSLAQSAGRDFL